jgi:hypothetical protein
VVMFKEARVFTIFWGIGKPVEFSILTKKLTFNNLYKSGKVLIFITTSYFKHAVVASDIFNWFTTSAKKVMFNSLLKLLIDVIFNLFSIVFTFSGKGII